MSERQLTDQELFSFKKIDEKASEKIASPQYSFWKSVFRKFFSSKIAIAMLLLALFVILMSAIQPIFSGYNPMSADNINNPSMRFVRPNLQYIFGTDDSGNSLFDAVWAGTRNSLFIAFTATIITQVIGISIGMIWGFSKKIDAIMIQVYNVIANIPMTLLAMVLVYALGPGIWQLIFALCITSWINTAYFIRVQVMIIRDREYNLASKCLGTSTFKIITHNIFPYLISVIMTSISRDVPSFISYEVFLSFIGIGLTKEQPSLGQMISKYAQYMNSTPYLFWIPVCISAFISVSLYIVGQTLADASDPRTHMV